MCYCGLMGGEVKEVSRSGKLWQSVRRKRELNHSLCILTADLQTKNGKDWQLLPHILKEMYVFEKWINLNKTDQSMVSVVFSTDCCLEGINGYCSSICSELLEN